MYIAICEDKAADRKHLERLLGRESDRRTDIEGNLQVDSFGTSGALMPTATIYDLFFVELAAEPGASIALARRLRETGVVSPICILCDEDAGQDTAPLSDVSLDSIFYLQKPIRPEALSGVITQALEMIKKKKPAYEIRCQENTVYISAEDFVCCAADGARHCIVCLSDGRRLPVPDFTEHVAGALFGHPSLIVLNKKCLINAVHVKEVGALSVTLSTGDRFRVGPLEIRELKRRIKALGG